MESGVEILIDSQLKFLADLEKCAACFPAPYLRYTLGRHEKHVPDLGKYLHYIFDNAMPS